MAATVQRVAQMPLHHRLAREASTAWMDQKLLPWHDQQIGWGKRQDRIKCVHHNLDLFEALNDSLDLVFVLQMQRE